METFRKIFSIFSFDCTLGLKEYTKDVLQMHKKYRKIHNAKPLRLSKRLTKGAMRYAKKLAMKLKIIQHSRLYINMKVGENLLMSAMPLTGATVVKTWYDQVYNYDFKNQIGKNDAPYSAFTQVVWKGTRRIGVGRAVGKVNGQWFAYYCVRYEPSGFHGSVENFKENVEKGKFNVFQFMNQGWSFGMNGYASWGMEGLYTFASSALNAHNQLRSLHKVPALTLDSDLSIKAMEKITETKRSVLRSEPGMNVFEICKGTISAAGVTKEWYRDVCYYDFDKQDSQQATKSQFRQVIWKDTTNFGISYKMVKNENEKKCLRVVAFYSAAMEETNANLKKQVKKGKFKGCHNGAFTYKGGIVIT